MTAVILGLFTMVAAGVLVAMLVSTCVSYRTRRHVAAPASSLPATSLCSELLWSAIPWLIVVAAITPSVMSIMR